MFEKLKRRLLKTKYYVKNSFKMFDNNSIGLLPAHIAFFTLWSVVPLYIVWDVVMKLMPVLSENSDLVDLVKTNGFIGEIQVDSVITGQNIFFFLVLIYLSSKAFEAIINASNYIYGFKSKTNFLKTKLKSIAFTCLIVITFAVVLLLLVIGNQVLDVIEKYLGSSKILDYVSTTKLPVTLVFIFIVVYLIYHFAPSGKIQFRRSLPGTLFTTFSWIIVSWGYAFYIDNFADYTKVYSSFAGIIILMVWIYLISYILVIGLVFNATYFEEKNIDKIRNSIENT